MRLVFIGSSEFGLKCLKACLEIPAVKVAGVVTAPKTFEISYRPQGVTNVLHADVAGLADANNIQAVTLERSMSDPSLLEAVAAWKPYAFLVAGWYHMIPKQWRELAPAYGLHASLLPDYSGGAPLVWAIINGENKTGITLFQMDDGIDSGPIAGQREEPIYPDDTIATLYARIEKHGLALLHKALPKMAGGELKLIPQDETMRRIYPQRSPSDGLIDWTQDEQTIERFIRAQTRPYPGAFTTLDGKPLHIWAVTMASSSAASETGQVHRHDENKYTVSTRGGSIELEEVSYESEIYTRCELGRLFGGGGRDWGYRRAARLVRKVKERAPRAAI
jgi:methionyl-tRNA formyltransferase